MKEITRKREKEEVVSHHYKGYSASILEMILFPFRIRFHSPVNTNTKSHNIIQQIIFACKFDISQYTYTHIGTDTDASFQIEMYYINFD